MALNEQMGTFGDFKYPDPCPQFKNYFSNNVRYGVYSDFNF
jgi:hypothetical protein